MLVLAQTAFSESYTVGERNLISHMHWVVLEFQLITDYLSKVVLMTQVGSWATTRRKISHNLMLR
jgi:hypothetical protein